MTFNALLETRLNRAAGRDRKQAAGPEGAAGAFEESAAGQLVAKLDDKGRRAAALWFHLCLCQARTDAVNVRAVRAFAAMRLGWTAAEAVTLAGRVTGEGDKVYSERTAPMVELAVAALESLPPDALRPLLPTVVELGKWLPSVKGAAAREELRRRVEALAPPERDDATGLPRAVLDGDDTYGPRMRAEHAAVLATPGTAALLTHCATLDAVRPPVKWSAQAGQLLAGAPQAAEVVRRLLNGFVQQPEGTIAVRRSYSATSMERGLIGPANTRLVRGLLWVLPDLDGEWVVPLAGDCARYAATGLGGSGGVARSINVATTAVAVLASFDGARGEQAVRALAAVRAKVRNRTVLGAAERAQQEVAARVGLSPARMRERSVPSAGLDGLRVREVALPGGHSAVLSVDGAATASFTFRTPAGRLVKTAPKAVKDNHPTELASLRAALKELRGLLSAERARLEECLAAGTSWTGADWQRLYADHPVTGALAGLLLWEVEAAGSGAWTAGVPERAGAGWVLAGADGTAAPVGPADRVRLWHPLRAEVDDVRAWRTAFDAREVRQPFKQVFREVYLVTPAEEATAGYSNRFAAHILRLQQARSLMAARGWSADHLGHWDGGFNGEAVREIPGPGPDDGWRATFSYQLVDEAPGGHTVSLCATDRVRFEQRTGAHGDWLPREPAQVPALMFSEAMRDVDLFVGVASIAADPLWYDGGDERHRDYWHGAAFGELPASAEVRKEALARLLPRTRIADRVELTGRFLRVRGDLGTYRIHLGSGNVLMEPNDAYLCIVPARGKGVGSLFLPFEEDGGILAVILSKAFLLAADTAITDPAITRQLPSPRPAPNPR